MFGEDPVVWPGYTMYKDPNVKDTYKISNWYDLAGANNIDFTFTWDGDSIVKVVNGQWLGIGEYYAGELSDLIGQEMTPSYYDAETKTFYFGMGYYTGNQLVGMGYETFTLDENEVAAIARGYRNVSASPKAAGWNTNYTKVAGPQIAGLAAERTTSKAVDFTVKSIKVEKKSMKLSNKKIVVE